MDLRIWRLTQDLRGFWPKKGSRYPFCVDLGKKGPKRVQKGSKKGSIFGYPIFMDWLIITLKGEIEGPKRVQKWSKKGSKRGQKGGTQKGVKRVILSLFGVHFGVPFGTHFWGHFWVKYPIYFTSCVVSWDGSGALCAGRDP
jgi:hypothetical protein